MSRSSFAEAQIPTGVQDTLYPDFRKVARGFGLHLTDKFIGQLIGRGVTEAGLVTQRAADIPAEGTVDVVSDDAGDDSQSITIYGLDGDDNVISETLDLDGTNAVNGVVDFTKVLAVVLSAAAAGTVTVDDTVLPTNLFTLAAGVLTRGYAAEAVEASGVLTVSVDTNAAVQIAVLGLDADGLPVSESFDLTTAATTPVVGSVEFAQITAILLGDVAAARTVSVTPGDTELTGIPFEPAIVDIHVVGVLAQRRLPGSAGDVQVNLITGAAAAADIAVAADDPAVPSWKVTLPRALAPAESTVHVVCAGVQNANGGL